MQAKMPIGNADGQKLCNQYGIYEVRNHFFVPGCVHQVADSVVGTGEGVADDRFWTSPKDFFTHFAGDKAVGFSVDDQNGDFTVADGLGGGDFTDVKPAEEQPP